MSDTCCGITYVKGESFCIKCGKPLGNYTDSAFVPEKDITDCPTVIIDMAQIAEELRGKNDDSEMETVALRQEDKLDSAFEDVLNAPAGENAVIEQPVQPANPNQKAGMQQGQVNRPVNAAPGQQRPVNAAPGQQRPANSASGQPRPVNNAQGQQRPVNAAPGQQRPANSAPGQQRPVNAAPGQQRPANNAPAQQPGPQLPAVQPRQNRPAAPVQRPVAVRRNENDIREKKVNDKSVGMLVACIIVIAITVFGLGAILLFTYKYKISPDYNQYSGEAAAGVLEYNIPEDDAENGGGN